MDACAHLLQVRPQLQQALQAGARRAARAPLRGGIPGRAARQRGCAVRDQRLPQLLRSGGGISKPSNWD